MADDNENLTQSRSRLERFVTLFVRHDVEFLVIGGQAEILMGGARVTFDTDLCYHRSAENLERLASALAEVNPSLRGAPADLPFILDAKALAFGNNYTLTTDIGALDLLGWVEPIGDYNALLARAESHVVRQIPVRTIGLEDLIRIKQHINRPKDRDSLFQLVAIRAIRNEQRNEATDEHD
jgi:hypothetical protein